MFLNRFRCVIGTREKQLQHFKKKSATDLQYFYTAKRATNKSEQCEHNNYFVFLTIENVSFEIITSFISDIVTLVLNNFDHM